MADYNTPSTPPAAEAITFSRHPHLSTPESRGTAHAEYHTDK